MMLKMLIDWIKHLFTKPVASPHPARVKVYKPLNEMTEADRQRAQDMLDDFLGHMNFTYRPDQVSNDNFRSLCALAFYGGWEAGFWDAYNSPDGEETPCHGVSLRAFEAGIKAGATRAALWIPPSPQG